MTQDIFAPRWPEAFDPAVRLARNVVVTGLGPAFSGGLPLADTFYRYPWSIAKGGAIALASLARRRAEKLPDEAHWAIVHSQWTAGYYHWLTEALPRALAVQRAAPEACILLPQSHGTFHPASLDLLGIAHRRFPAHNLRLGSAHVSTCARHYGTTAPAILRELRQRFSESVEAPGGGDRRLYVSRRKARGRKVANEAEVIATLADFGFEEIIAEDLAFADQVRLFSQASMLIGIHGAGLTNMLFMPAGGAVLELLPFRNGLFDLRPNSLTLRHDHCYIALAEALGHRHHHLQCAHDAGRFSRTALANITVDCSALAAEVRLMMSAR